LDEGAHETLDAGEVQGSTQALVSDSDGDGVPDSTDNCPTIANATQANSNGFGPGDACELSFVLSSGLLNQYVYFQSQRELLASLGPLSLGLGPDLMRASVPAPPLAFANASLLTQRLGVQSLGELLTGYTDTIGGNEVLQVELGSDAVLGGAKSSDVWLRLDGTATVSVTFYQGGTSVGSQSLSTSGTQRVRFSAGGALFDRIEIRATSGAWGSRGLGRSSASRWATRCCPAAWATRG